MQPTTQMNKSLGLVLLIVTLDAMGLGLVMPVLPALLREFLPSHQIPSHYGILLSLYAVMQVIFAPILGRLSDRYGRRPILLASLLGATVDYAIMAATPTFWVLYIGRLLSGITGATGAVAASAIADSTNTTERATWFGYMGACYGGGMIAGPALGGLLGAFSVHGPFVAAALLNGIGLLLACYALKESRTHTGAYQAKKRSTTYPRKPELAGLTGLLLVFFLVQLIGQAPASLWVIYGEDRFHWNTAMVGISLAGFGAVHAFFQAFLTGPLTKNLGEKKTITVGMTADAIGLLFLAFATQSWMVVPILFLLAAGGIAMPALQALLSNTTNSEAQGTLQGTLTSLTNLSAIIGPLGFTALYTATSWNGWAWITGALLYAICLFALSRR